MTGRLDARAMFLCLIMFIVAALHARTMLAVGLCLVVAITVAYSVRLEIHEVWRAFRPLVPIAIITVVMQVLTNQAGEIFAPLVRSSFRRADTLGEAFLTRCFSCGIEATALHSGCFGIRECVVLLCTAVFSVATFLL